MALTADAPPAQAPWRVAACAVGGGEQQARAARLWGGDLEVTLLDGRVVRVASGELRAAGDGRDPIDVVLRPGAWTLTVTWRDGRRGRFDVGSLVARGLTVAA